MANSHKAPSLPRPSTSDDAMASIEYSRFKDETQLEDIIGLISNDLSEPYSIYVYRYFIQQWPDLCFLAYGNNVLVGVLIAKLEKHRLALRGYIAMLAVRAQYRGRGIGKAHRGRNVTLATALVESALTEMIHKGAEEICLETETTNEAAMSLYENMGFIRYKRLHRYYLNAGDAFRFILPIKHPITENIL